MKRIETHDANGKYNGYVVPLWHADTGPDISQVYITAVAPGCVKGPHLHLKRRGLFYLISGSGVLVIRQDTRARGEYIAIRNPHEAVVFAGEPCALYNTGNVDAVFLNMPSPPWRESEPDEHPVEGWDFKL